jgi:hypothetical protein
MQNIHGHHKIGICDLSAKHAVLIKEKEQTGWFEIWIMCPSGVTYVYPRTIVSVR